MPDAGRGFHFVNAANAAGERFALRTHAAHIAALETAPAAERRVDLQGDRLLPGLINAHDHLQLNHFPRLRYRERYDNATQWIDDIRPRLKSDPMLRDGRAPPREQRLLVGGLKNLLSGATTVAHHDPLYSALRARDFPVRVVADYGWAHSLQLDGDEAVQCSSHATPAGQPWIIHAAEGTDAAAAAEFARLAQLDCLRANTVLVHGVALDRGQRARLLTAGAGLIWCPSSNKYLFGRTVDCVDLIAAGRVAVGSDSRLSGGRDLLQELQLVDELTGLHESGLESLVTSRAAQLLCLPDRGALRPGLLADLIVLPAGMPLSRAQRADLRLVILGGVACYGDHDYARALGIADEVLPVRVDGRRKFLRAGLVARLAASPLREPGVELTNESRLQ